jgi:hypothetical protein
LNLKYILFFWICEEGGASGDFGAERRRHGSGAKKRSALFAISSSVVERSLRRVPATMREITTAQDNFKTATGMSRKYFIVCPEYLERSKEVLRKRGVAPVNLGV